MDALNPEQATIRAVLNLFARSPGGNWPSAGGRPSGRPSDMRTAYHMRRSRNRFDWKRIVVDWIGATKAAERRI
jgi:hypothetical protein